jgi:diguanylate cyclase (GGDEF)-like protein
MPDPSLQADCATPTEAPEPQKILAQAAQIVAGLCCASDHCVERLDEIERQIEETSAIEGARVLRFQLTECLQKLREEAWRQRDQMSQALGRLEGQLEIAQGARPDLPPALDKLTGLEMRDSAEQALAAAMERGGPSYAALFVVDRLHLINAQFGYTTGDQILRTVGGHLRSRLLPQDLLYRWTGPAFVAVLERGPEIEAEIERITAAKLEVGVQIGNGSVLLPVACAGLLIRLSAMTGLAELTKRMDAYTGEQTRH